MTEPAKRRHTYVTDESVRREQEKGLDDMRVARNRGYLLALAGWIFAVLLLVAVLLMLPLKTAVPVIVTVDSATGHVEQTQIATPSVISANESLVMSELHDYVINRMTVDPSNRQRLDDFVRLHSTPSVAKAYAYEMSADNPDNPYYLVGAGGMRKVEITGISLPSNGLGQVFFRTTTIKPGVARRTEYFQATIRYAFTGKPLALRDRWINPLGFAVTAWRRDQELSR